MKIIIVGCGKVGYALVKSLSAEGHDITVIDTNPELLATCERNFDVQVVAGNGASYTVLQEANIESCELLIAVTFSDEINLLCCLYGKKGSECQTIARVRNPIYHREVGFLKGQLGISLVVNPGRMAALEIARILRFPSAIEIDTFANGRIELLQFNVPDHSVLCDKTLIELHNTLKSQVLFCTVVRGDEVIIPNGQFKLKAGDMAGIIASPNAAKTFFSRVGIEIHRVPNALIIGGGTICYYLVDELLRHGIDVRVIENDHNRCKVLSEAYPDALVLCADGTDQDILREEGIESVGGVVALTGIDEENIVLSLFAQQCNPQAKIITKTNRYSIDSLINQLHLSTMIHPKDITAEAILRYVRATQNSIGSNVETLYNLIDGRVEALEFIIHEDAPVLNKPLSQMKLKENVLVAGIFRRGSVILPVGSTEIEVGDSVIVVTTNPGFQDIKDILQTTG